MEPISLDIQLICNVAAGTLIGLIVFTIALSLLLSAYQFYKATQYFIDYEFFGIWVTIALASSVLAVYTWNSSGHNTIKYLSRFVSLASILFVVYNIYDEIFKKD